jgi:hypothetical protein
MLVIVHHGHKITGTLFPIYWSSYYRKWITKQVIMHGWWQVSNKFITFSAYAWYFRMWMIQTSFALKDNTYNTRVQFVPIRKHDCFSCCELISWPIFVCWYCFRYALVEPRGVSRYGLSNTPYNWATLVTAYLNQLLEFKLSYLFQHGIFPTRSVLMHSQW